MLYWGWMVATGGGDNKLDLEVRIKTQQVKDGLGEVVQSVDQAMQDVADSAQQAGTAMEAALDGALDGVQADGVAAAEGVSQALDQTAEAAERAGSEIDQALADVGTQGLAAGEQLESGLGDALIQVGDDAAQAATEVDRAMNSLADSSNTAGQQLDAALAGAADQADEIVTSTNQASDGVAQLGDEAGKTGQSYEQMRQGVDRTTAAIKAQIQEQHSEIELQRQHLALEAEQQQAILRTAKARGDETAATQAENRLREIAAQQLGLVAQAKRTEAAAIQQSIAARRQELAAVGPLTDAQQRELQAAENHARALRVQAAASDTAAQKTRQHAAAAREGAIATQEMGQQAQVATRLLGQMAATLGGAFTFRELVNAAAQMESIQAGLKAVSQDAVQAGRDLDFVRDIAGRTGADAIEVGKAFLSLAAATRGTAVEGEPTRQVFEAVATAMGKAGKSSAETQNALTALAQMASKGVVSMEELRGQLGEALPGALQAAAKGMGITTEDLIKLVEQGKIATSQLFPALSRGLAELYGTASADSQTLTQEIGNIKNAFTDLSTNIGEAGGLQALKVGAEVAQTALVILDDTLITVGKTVGVVAAAIANWDFSGLKQAFSDIEQESRDKLLKAAQHNEVLRGYLGAMGDEATKAALAQQQLAAETAKTQKAVTGQVDALAKLDVDYQKNIESIEQQVDLAKQSVIARDAEAKAASLLADAMGLAGRFRNAEIDAMQKAAAAQEQEAERRLTLVNVLKAQREATVAAIEKGAKPESEENKKRIAELDKLIEKRQAEADQSLAVAKSTKVRADELRIESEMLRDNSGRVDELRAAWERASVQLEEARKLKAASKLTDEQYTEVVKKAIEANRLYADALGDVAEKTRATNAAKQAQSHLEQAGLRVTLEAAKAIYEVAKATGDERGAAQALVEIKRLEIELARLQAQAKRAEAAAALEMIKAKRQELEATGQLTAAKRAELQAQELAAKAKQKEADIADITANKMEALAAATLRARDATSGAAGSFDTLSESIGGSNDALDRHLQLRDQAAKAPDVSSVGGSAGGDGFTRTAKGSATLQDIIKELRGYGLDDATAQRIASDFVDPSTGRLPDLGRSVGHSRYATSEYDTWSVALQRAAQEALGARGLAGQPVGDNSGGLRSSPPGRVVVEMGGRSTTINTASVGDQQALMGLFRELESASGVAVR